MIYAPILITTLNRYECLEKCINSLAKNSWADNTEVFISVDYPPSKNYYDGYIKVLEFLKKEICGFKKVNIFYQKRNLGPFDNSRWLKEIVSERGYDRYIYVEDDTEAAPGLLEFFDKGLEIFKNNKDIIGINASDYVWCGNGYTPAVNEIDDNDNNIEKRQLVFHASAVWFEKEKEIEKFINNEITQIVYKKEIMKKLYSKSKTFFYQYINTILRRKDLLPWYKGKIVSIDMVWDIYMIIYDKYVITPRTSLIRDLGVTGNGFNYKDEFENKDQLLNRKLNEDMHFRYKDISAVGINEKELLLHDFNIEVSYLSRIRTILFYLFYKNFKEKI